MCIYIYIYIYIYVGYIYCVFLKKIVCWKVVLNCPEQFIIFLQLATFEQVQKWKNCPKQFAFEHVHYIRYELHYITAYYITLWEGKRLSFILQKQLLHLRPQTAVQPSRTLWGAPTPKRHKTAQNRAPKSPLNPL